MKKILALIAIVTLVSSCGSGTSTEISSEDTTIVVDSIASIDTTSFVVDTTMTESK